jgi:uncharacterized protein (TIGR03118 family)
MLHCAIPSDQMLTPGRPLGMVIPSLLEGMGFTPGYLCAEAAQPPESVCRPVAAPDCLGAPHGIAFDTEGSGYVADTERCTVAVFATTAERPDHHIVVPAAPPSGIVLTDRHRFTFGDGSLPQLLIGTTDGAIAAWNGSCGETARIVVEHGRDGERRYTGIAVGQSHSGPVLFAANSAHGTIDRFDAGFHYLNSFTDPALPDGAMPQGIACIAGEVFVMFARPQAEPGNGCVGVFSTEGRLLRCLRTRSVFNVPSALVLAPAGFGVFPHHLLIGNRGDGTINAFDPESGAFVGRLRDPHGRPLTLRGLRGVAFGPDPETLFVTTGPEDGGVSGVHAITVRGPRSETAASYATTRVPAPLLPTK